ncbi:MAG: transmembrane 220 family protein [Gammaproteobacteria bacterium]|nr:transmembrane 220 family protein [Gammaproteobacteria bacterium]
MKALHFILAALFLYMAYLQFNDPDPLYWIIIYAGTAAIALAMGLDRSSDFWTTILIGATAAGMIITTPSVAEFIAAGDFTAIGDMDRAPYVEPAREFGGLLLALVLLLYYYKRLH